MPHVLILGAKSDIAVATARQYAGQGYDIILAARQAASLEGIATDMTVRYQQSVECVEFDVCAVENHKKFFDALPVPLGGVISFIGYMGDQVTTQGNSSEAAKIIATNYSSIAALFEIIAQDMEARSDGFIVGVSSVAGDRGRQSNYFYGAAKAAFSAYLSGLRNRLHTSGVNVLTVKPGFVDTKMTAGMDLPKLLTASPEGVARDIYRAQQKCRAVIYSRWYWRWLMLIIKLIPESIFKKLNL